MFYNMRKACFCVSRYEQPIILSTMNQELEIVYTPEASEVSKSLGALAHLVQTLTPDTTLTLREWQQLNHVYRLIGDHLSMVADSDRARSNYGLSVQT